METIIGIDLGTSTTEAAVIRDGNVELLLNFVGEKITPSVVGIDQEGNYVVGSKAKAQLLLEPEKTAIEIKRKIGSDEKIRLGKEERTPIELSTMILEYVKRYASDALGEEITKAVISVPAYFDDIQRQATVEAGKRAGLSVERIINEPTAAALSYGIGHMEEESHILVYDLGGGTFDVTLLELYSGIVEVKASSGDNKLGGKDFDERIIKLLTDRFFKTHGVRLEQNAYAMVKLKEQAEQCKIALSTCDSYTVSLPFLIEHKGAPLAMEEVVTKEIFEELISELVERTHMPIEVVLSDSGLLKEEIDMILLVGGSTKVPLVKKDIEQFLGMEASSAVNPDFAVAEGAAIQAGMISGAISSENGIIMTDVNPFTLGVKTVNSFDFDYMSVIIPRNITIPVTKKETYSTYGDFQTEAVVEIYQGESSTASSNHFLGKFLVKGIPPRKEGEESIEVGFSYNQNGMLVVTAVILSTGQVATIEINMLEAMKEKPTHNLIDVSAWKNLPHAKRFKATIRRAEKALNQGELADDMELKEALEGLIYDLKLSILEESMEAEDIEDDILDFLDDFAD